MSTSYAGGRKRYPRFLRQNKRKQPEREIKKSLLTLLKAHFPQSYFEVNRTTGTYSVKLNRWLSSPNKGKSDITGVIYPTGRAIAIEIKSNKTEMDKWLKIKQMVDKGIFVDKKKYNREIDQIEYLNNITQAGGIGFVCYDPEQAVEYLKEQLRKYT